LTGPPRFIGVPRRTPTPAAPTPGVTTARATGRGRKTTPGLTTHPTGYSTYWQYTTALALSELAATKPITKPVVNSTDNAIERFILASSNTQFFCIMVRPRDPRIDADQAPYARDYSVMLFEVAGRIATA
jgi:hypothetical protein